MTDRTPAIEVDALSETFRYGQGLADVLTDFCYHEDDVTLEATAERPLPAAAYTAPTDGLASVLASDPSVAMVVHDDDGHEMTNPTESAIIETLTTAIHHPPADPGVSIGVVTPHNAQRGALAARLPTSVEANTVERYQGGERDVIIVSGTVSDPNFARGEQQFLLDARRLLVAISRARLLTVVVCARGLLSLVPTTDPGDRAVPAWARLYAIVAGRDPTPAWTGSLDAFAPTPQPRGHVELEVVHDGD